MSPDRPQIRDAGRTGPVDNSDLAPIFDLVQLRRDTATPIYQQLETQLLGLIDSGRLAAGQALPAERQLAEVLGVSRSTVQQCYNNLRARGLIQGHGRHGSIVQKAAAILSPRMNRLKGFSEWAQELGKNPTTRVLERDIVVDRAVASLFGLPTQSRFLKLVRVRSADDVPISVESAWYNLQAVPSLESADGSGSIYAQLAFQGTPLTYCDQTIDAVSPSREECELFGVLPSMPCLMIKRRSYIANNTMVEYVEGVFRGDAYSYELRLDA